MTDTDISPLTRLTASALSADPALRLRVINVLQAADSDGQANAEDSVFSEAEVLAYINQNRAAQRRVLALFRAHRPHLAGSLSSAQDRVRSHPGGEELANFLQAVAGFDANQEGISEDQRSQLAAELSEEELSAAAQNLENSAVTPDSLAQELVTLLQAVQEMEIGTPEAFVPADPAEQRASIDLNFLKIMSLSGDDPDTMVLRNLLEIAGASPDQRDGDWSISFEEVQAYLTQVEAARQRALEEGVDPSELPVIDDPVRTMAELRFVAHQRRINVNEILEGTVSTDPEMDQVRLSVQPLIDRQAQINDPAVDQVLALAGNAMLTVFEAERLIQFEERAQPGFLESLLADAPPASAGQSDLERAASQYLSEIRRLVERYNHEVVLLNPGPSSTTESSGDANLDRSRHVLLALENMRTGFTHRDRQYAEGNALVGLIDMLTYVGTLGGGLSALVNGALSLVGWDYNFNELQLSPDEAGEYGADWPRFGATYRHYVRANVQRHDQERGAALEALRNIIEHPPADFRGARTIPNALDYLRDHDDTEYFSTGRGMNGTRGGAVVPGTGNHRRYYELLTGEFFQARRLWEIHSETDAQDQANMWYDFAQNLRSGEAGPGFFEWLVTDPATHSSGVRNLEFSRAILNSLQSQSREPAMRSRANLAYRDSMGMAILDSEGHTVTADGGEFGLNPYLWFRNYSDENADAVASDVVALGASFYIAGGTTSIGRTALTSAGRSSLATGFLSRFGIRTTQVAVTEASVGTAIEGSTAGLGIFGRLMSRAGGPAFASRVVAQREAMLRAAQAALAEGSGTAAEVARAESALLWARRFQAGVSAPTAGAGVEAAAPRLTGWGSRVVSAHPPIPTALATAATGTGLRAALARGGVATLSNISLQGLGRGLHWLSFTGLFYFGITGLTFDQLRTRRPERMENFNRSFDLLLNYPPRATDRTPPPSSADSDAAGPEDAAAGDAADSATPFGDGWAAPTDEASHE